MDKPTELPSGTTSPKQPSTMSGSNPLRRNLSRETIASSVDTDVSQPSIAYPPPPINSPQSQSVAGDAHPTTHSQMDALADSLEHLKAPTVSSEDETSNEHSDERTATPTQLSKVSSAPQTYEHSNWGTVASEDVELGLKRLAMLAKDEHTKDNSKTVQEYYSARLAKLIKRAEIEFDPKDLVGK